MKREAQRGSAMLVTLIIVAALLGGAAVLVSLQLATSRSSDLERTGTSALYCAEAGLDIALQVVATNQGSWNSALADSAGGDTSGKGVGTLWLYNGINGIGSHSLPGDTTEDFAVYLKDDADETGTQDYTHDNNGKVYIVSRCLKYADEPKEVEELLEVNGGGQAYNGQAGFGTGAGQATSYP